MFCASRFRYATIGWEKLPNFPYPMPLPVFHPDYQCTGGRNENLSMSIDLAKQRIYYVDPEQFAQNVLIQTSGQISVVNGPPLVAGTDSNWNKDLIGAVLQVSGDETAYSIIAVISSNKLILSRIYNGASISSTDYTIRTNTFGQIHDYLVHLVNGGPSAGSMKDRYSSPYCKCRNCFCC